MLLMVVCSYYGRVMNRNRFAAPIGTLAVALWLMIATFPLPAIAVQSQTAAPAAQSQGAQPAPSRMRQPERLVYKPSGFWTSSRPAVGGAYRYGMLLVGTLAGVMGGVLIFVVLRRHRGMRDRNLPAWAVDPAPTPVSPGPEQTREP